MSARLWGAALLLGGCFYDPGGVLDQVCTSHAACDDGLVCTGVERCDPHHERAHPITGCVLDEPLACESSPCAAAACVEPDGCAKTPAVAGAPCDDGLDCTVGDACDGEGVCAGDPDDARCPEAPTCYAATCDPDAGCAEAPLDVGAACDALDCTGGDTCDGEGRCVAGAGAPVAGQVCASDLSCDAQVCSAWGDETLCGCDCGDDGIIWEFSGGASGYFLLFGAAVLEVQSDAREIAGPLECADEVRALSSSFISDTPVGFTLEVPCAASWADLLAWSAVGGTEVGSLVLYGGDSGETARLNLYDVTLTSLAPEGACEGVGTAVLEVGHIEGI